MVVDFHAYFQTPSFLERLRRRRDYPFIENTADGEVIWSGPGAARRIRPEQTDIALRARQLAEAGIDTQILRLQNVSGIDAFDPEEGRDIAQAANEEMSELARRYPGRFVPYAAVPMRNVKSAVAELDRAVTQLGHQGVGISTSVEGKPLDHPDFEALFECAARLNVPVLILPNHPSLIDGAIGEYGWLTGAFGFQVDLSLVGLRLLASGRLDRYPRLPLILANLGGVFPFIIERLEGYWARVHAGARPLPVRPVEALRRYYLETASGHPAAIRMTAEVMGADRLLFGSDYPSFDFVRALRSVHESGLPSDQIALILGGNAKQLVRLQV
ncbi:MAG: Amidohydrolase family [Burkholderiales bacterium]|jgi:predicted TIM-barrel fold metal-dependent hydrolase|nr:Amidohydrolase family [Burkholderiales bacterium]